MNIVIINRWNDKFSCYRNYIDHSRHNISYITTPNNTSNLVASGAKKIILVDDIADFAKLIVAVNESMDTLGCIDRIIALSEFDLINAARLREYFKVKGNLPKEVAKFRDKVVMKRAVSEAGLRAPNYSELHSYEDVIEFAKKHEFPLIIKPRDGAASIGVIKVHSLEELENYRDLIIPEKYQIEQYIDGAIYHIDGIVDGFGVAFSKVSKYINTCLGFSQGGPLGSYIISESLFSKRLEDFTGKCLSVLGILNSAFHLEVICKDDVFYFLEVGARVGGGEIPFTMAEVYDVDLYREWIYLELSGGLSRLRDMKNKSIYSGFVLFPEPVGKSLVKINYESNLPAVYSAIFPSPGHFFDGNGGYETILARFRIKAANAELVEDTIRKIISNLSYEVI